MGTCESALTEARPGATRGGYAFPTAAGPRPPLPSSRLCGYAYQLSSSRQSEIRSGTGRGWDRLHGMLRDTAPWHFVEKICADFEGPLFTRFRRMRSRLTAGELAIGPTVSVEEGATGRGPRGWRTEADYVSTRGR